VKVRTRIVLGRLSPIHSENVRPKRALNRIRSHPSQMVTSRNSHRIYPSQTPVVLCPTSVATSVKQIDEDDGGTAGWAPFLSNLLQRPVPAFLWVRRKTRPIRLFGTKGQLLVCLR